MTWYFQRSEKHFGFQDQAPCFIKLLDVTFKTSYGSVSYFVYQGSSKLLSPLYLRLQRDFDSVRRPV